jgi:hypothetical protein
VVAAVLAVLLAALLGASASDAAASPAHRNSASMCGVLRKAPRYRHVIVIMEENTSYTNIVGSSSAPYINQVINSCGLATNYHNITHPSLPNYIGLADGAPLNQLGPLENDCNPGPGCQSDRASIFSQVASGGGWRSYDESMPQPCDASDSGYYAVRHNPAVYFPGLPDCAANDVGLGAIGNSRLLQDLSSEATAPAFALVTPNLCHDMHGADGCPGDPIRAGDAWLRNWLAQLTGTRVYRSHDAAVFIVWDEGDSGNTGQRCAVNTRDPGCRVAAIAVAPSVRHRARLKALLNHYSLLKTTEDLLGLSELGRAQTASSAAPGFNL